MQGAQRDSRCGQRIRIGLLGPVSVRHDGISHPIEAPRHRNLIAALALEAGQAVPAADLADAVWDRRPTPGWRGTLRSYVKRLRQACPSLRSRIETCRPGYRLAVEPDDIDVLMFERLCADAHRAVWDGDWHSAADTFATALELWRGEAFADISSLVIRTRRRDLTETVLGAAIGRVESLRRCDEPQATLTAYAQARDILRRAGVSDGSRLDEVTRRIGG